MDQFGLGIGAFLGFVIWGLLTTLRRLVTGNDDEELSELKERLTRAEEQLNSEIKTNGLLQKMIDEQAADLKRFEERWAQAWNQLQQRTGELFKTRDELHDAKTENALLNKELESLKVQVADHEKRLEALKQAREEIAAEARANEQLALLNRGYFEGIPKFLKEMGIDEVVQEMIKNLQHLNNGHSPTSSSDEKTEDTEKEVNGG